MEIVNLHIKNEKDEFSQVNKLAPKMPCRILMIGKSGSGKTTNLINLVLKYLPWHTLCVFARHLEDDEKYEYLMDTIEKQEDKTGKKVSFFSDKISDLLPLDNYAHRGLFCSWPS